ncbi:hypothetical protein FQR65_LT20773 [Abscondita terminalis]|nr:hypothetical protein FQR65_LT20773 [Abscondita terminalis]
MPQDESIPTDAREIASQSPTEHSTGRLGAGSVSNACIVMLFLPFGFPFGTVMIVDLANAQAASLRVAGRMASDMMRFHGMWIAEVGTENQLAYSVAPGAIKSPVPRQGFRDKTGFAIHVDSYLVRREPFTKRRKPLLGTPDSAKVGTSGNCDEPDVPPELPIAFTLPLLMCGMIAIMLSNITGKRDTSKSEIGLVPNLCCFRSTDGFGNQDQRTAQQARIDHDRCAGVISRVLPSAGARATAALPMLRRHRHGYRSRMDAPEVFGQTFRELDAAAISDGPPGGQGTTTVTVESWPSFGPGRLAEKLAAAEMPHRSKFACRD